MPQAPAASAQQTFAITQAFFSAGFIGLLLGGVLSAGLSAFSFLRGLSAAFFSRT
jgi:hypothetical protein